MNNAAENAAMLRSQMPLPAEGGEIKVPAELFDAIVESEREFCETIRKIDPRVAVRDLIAGYKSSYTLVEPYLRKYSSPRILEIGTGNGFGFCHLLKLGCDAAGVEPGSEFSFEGRHGRALDLLRANGIDAPEQRLLPAPGERLPFEDSSFDIVFSIAVLEHVQNVEQCMREAVRVLRPGGVLIMNVPNYNAWWEGHYYFLWLPYVLSSKQLAKWYARHVMGRTDRYVDDLNFTSPRMFRRILGSFAGGGRFAIYPFLIGPLARLSAAYYYLAIGFAEKHRALGLIERLRLRPIALGIGSLFISALSGLGLAPTFNVVYFKHPEQKENR